MAAEWHYGQGEEQHGPVPLEELKQLVASGQVQPIDMVWNEDMPEWLPAKDVEELFPKQETASEAAEVEQPPSVPPKQPADVESSPRGRRLPFRTAVISIAAFCLVGLVVAGSFIFFSSRQKSGSPVEETATENAAKELKYEDVPENVENAMAVLKTNPADPEANLAVGRYHCFVKGDWDKGLPTLARGSDAALTQLATTELTKPTTAEEQKKLGDGWWEFAGSKVNFAWKGSQARAAHWYREAVARLEGPAKVEVEQKLNGLEEQPPDFEILGRRSNAKPSEEYCTVHCVHLSLEAQRTEKMPEKPGALGMGFVGLELKGVRFLELKVTTSPDLGGQNKNIFAGFMVDYQTAGSYTKRMALSVGPFNRDRNAKGPDWGKGDVPDDYVDLGMKDSYQLNLQEWAPPGWTGRVWFGLVLQQRTASTFLRAELVPHGANKDTVTAQAEKKGDGGKELGGSTGGGHGASAKAQVVDLLKMIDPNRDTVVGTWKFDGTPLTSGSKNCALAIPCSVPDEYTVVVVLDRREGKNAFRLGLVVGSRQSMVAIDGFSKDEWASGVSDIDGKPAVTNESKHTGQLLPEGASHTIECTVRRAAEDKARVTATVDGKEVVDWIGEYGRLSYPAKLPVLKEGSKPCLWLQSFDSTFVVSKLELRPIGTTPSVGK